MTHSYVVEIEDTETAEVCTASLRRREVACVLRWPERDVSSQLMGSWKQ